MQVVGVDGEVDGLRDLGENQGKRFDAAAGPLKLSGPGAAPCGVFDSPFVLHRPLSRPIRTGKRCDVFP